MTPQRDFAQCARDEQNRPLVCSGCARAAPDIAFPGSPSGALPCGFCVRNTRRAAFDDMAVKCGLIPRHTWYDGTPPLTLPMDCYCSADMGEQTRLWMREALA